MKVKVLDNSINSGWNVGDVVEIDDIVKYKPYVEFLEPLPVIKPKEVEKHVSKSKKKIK